MKIYEKHPHADAYRVGPSFAPYALVARANRFTDAELCAEFYKAAADHYEANSMHMMFEDAETEQKLSDARDWMYAMERFATLPHFDGAS